MSDATKYWDHVPTKRRKVLNRTYHELLIELRMHHEHTIPKADQVHAEMTGMTYEAWLETWDANIRWHVQTWIKEGDTDPASIKKRGRELAGIPSRFYMKKKPGHSVIDYAERLAAYEKDHGKAFGE